MSTIIDLSKLRNPTVGWKPIGKLPSSKLVWRFKTFDPIVERDQVPIREKTRFREIQLTDDLKKGTNVIAIYSNVEKIPTNQ